MAAALIVIGEAQVAAGFVVKPGHAAVVRIQPAFLHRLRIGLAVVPIVAVIAERDDRLALGQPGQALRDVVPEPAVRGHRAGIAGFGMLVVSHQHDLVGDIGEGGQVPGWVVNRHGGAHHFVARAQRGFQFAQKGLEIAQAAGGHPLEIDHDPAVAADRDVVLDLLFEHGAALGIVDDRGGEITVPLAVFGVLQHRHHQRLVQRAGQHAAEWCVIRRLHAPGLIEEQQRWRDPVDLAQVLGQRRRARFGPRCVERHGDRRGAGFGGFHRAGLAVEQVAELRRKARNLAFQRQRGAAFEPQRQRRGRGYRQHRGREGQAQQHHQRQRAQRPQPRIAAAAARGIEKYRTCHALVPELSFAPGRLVKLATCP